MRKQNILAHRGIWTNEREKNSRHALSTALETGFGLETDVRDLDGKLVISHDPPTSSDYIGLEWLLDFYASNKYPATLALNIKSDGLCSEIGTLIGRFELENTFVFDMSIPDTIPYVHQKIPFYSRLSEHEPEPAFPDFCSGIWLDGFNVDFPRIENMKRLRTLGKPIALVSPELHGRDHLKSWRDFRESGLSDDGHSLICTDYPEQALGYFGNTDK